MLTWECIGRYFNESTTQENLFDNDSVILLTGTDINFNNFVSSDNNAALTYRIDSNRTYDTQYPSRITFKLRLGSYSNSDSIKTFIAGLYIKYRAINGTNIPCFTISDEDNDAYYPFPEELMNNDLCNVELLWIDGTTTLIINDKQILSFKSENIISTSSNTILVHQDDFISLEISNLSFYRVTLYEKFRKPRVKIIQDGMKLTIESPELDSNSVIEKETMFRVVFSDLQQGFKVFNNDISIDGCTFSECIANDNTACELKYTDNDTNNEIVLRLYTFPSENHNKNENISEVFHYYKNIRINDLYVMELNVIQNSINLRGRYITFNYEGIGTVSKHLIQKHEEHSETTETTNDYYRFVLTKPGNSSNNTGLYAAKFSGLKFKQIDNKYEYNIQFETIEFTDESNNTYIADVEYLNGRLRDDGGRWYAPSSFFTERRDQTWIIGSVGTEFNAIYSESGKDLVYQITFKTNIDKSLIDYLTFNNLVNASDVNIKVYHSNDLKTWEQIAEKTVEYTKSLYRFDFDKKTYYKIILNSPKTETTDIEYYPTLTDMVFDDLDFNSASDRDSTHGTAVFESEGNELNAELYIQRPAASNLNNIYPSYLFKRSSDGYHVELWGYRDAQSNNSYIITFKNPVELSKLDFVLNLGDYIYNIHGLYDCKARRIYITLHEIDENGNVIQNLGTIYHENADFPNVQKIHADFSMMNIDVLAVFKV